MTDWVTEWGRGGGREGGRGGGEEGQGVWDGKGTDCSIISAQTPLGLRVRDSIARWRDKSLFLTFERIATYNNNPAKEGWGRGGGGWASHHIRVFTSFATEKCSSNTLPRKIRQSRNGSLKLCICSCLRVCVCVCVWSHSLRALLLIVLEMISHSKKKKRKKEKIKTARMPQSESSNPGF